MSCDHTAIEARSASDPPGSVDSKMSLLIRPGCSKASVWAMKPPIDHRSTLGPSKPSISITDTASSESWAIPNGLPLSLIGRGLAGIGGSGCSYADARWALISRSSATELALLRQRQIANATNKRSRTTNIATYVSPPMPKP